MSEHIYWQDDSGLYKREEIVRCRDCKYFASAEGLCMRLFNAMAVEPHGFCAWGLRRNDTDNGMEVDC